MIYSPNTQTEKVGNLLTAPSSDSEVSFQRTDCEFVDASIKFRIKDKNFSRQYAHLYAERLYTARPKLTDAAKRKWGKLYLKLSQTNTNEIHFLGDFFGVTTFRPFIGETKRTLATT